MLSPRLARVAVSTLAIAAFAVTAARAEQLAIGNYGSSANGMPFGVALYKGYFKEEGLDITGLIASQGGGTSVRNAMSGVAYGEANPGAIAVAIQQGADTQDRQRQCADRRRVRLAGEEGFADQDHRRS